MPDVTIGADPELFLRDVKTGRVHPVCGLVGGTKDKPVPLEGLGREGFAIQEDNVMLEFNVPPATSNSRADLYISKALTKIQEIVDKQSKGELELDFKSSRVFGPDQLTSDGSKIFGCSPDFSGYAKGKANPVVEQSALAVPSSLGDEWRFAGGHIHMGLKTTIPPYAIAQFCDLFIGLPYVGIDKQGPRRALYGQGGRYRPKSYGIEYRTLSNFWVVHPGIRMQVLRSAFDLGYHLQNASEKNINDFYKKVPWQDVKTAIDTEDEAMASRLIRYMHSDLPRGVFF